MNPPLRTRRDIDQLKEGIADGPITVLATDHAPPPPETKPPYFAPPSSGLPRLPRRSHAGDRRSWGILRRP